MLIEQTLTQLHELKLTGMADALEEQRGVPDVQTLPFEDRFALLLERESSVRENRRRTRLLRQAKLRLPSATIEDLNFRAKRGLDRSVVLRLTGCDWIHQHQVTLITGATGTGKTFLACALGQAACRHGLSVRYFRLSRLLDELRIARADGSYTRLLDRLQRTAALLIDDFGLQALSETERRICSKCSRTDTDSALHSLPASFPSITGMTSSAMPPSATPSSIGSCITPTASNSRVLP